LVQDTLDHLRHFAGAGVLQRAERGADVLLEIRFDKSFSEQTGEAFIRGLARDLGGARRSLFAATAHFKRACNAPGLAPWQPDVMPFWSKASSYAVVLV
jgi:hypothetical protein